MAIKIISLTQCPFCDDTEGDVFLDPNVAYDLVESQEQPKSEETNLAMLVTHNSPQAADGPCPHLVQLFLDVSWGRDLEDHLFSKYTVEVGWKCPPLRELPVGHPARRLLLEFEFGHGHEDFLPPEPHVFDDFKARWRDFKQVDKPGHAFEVSGRTVFARHIPSFIGDLNFQHERIQAATESGRDVRGEWRQILAHQNRESEQVEYEYEE